MKNQFSPLNRPRRRRRRPITTTYLRWTCERFAVDAMISSERRLKCLKRSKGTLVRAIGLRSCQKYENLLRESRFERAETVVVADDEEGAVSGASS